MTGLPDNDDELATMQNYVTSKLELKRRRTKTTACTTTLANGTTINAGPPTVKCIRCFRNVFKGVPESSFLHYPKKGWVCADCKAQADPYLKGST